MTSTPTGLWPKYNNIDMVSIVTKKITKYMYKLPFFKPTDIVEKTYSKCHKYYHSLLSMNLI